MEISRRTAIAALIASGGFCRAWASSPGRLMVVTASAAGPHVAVVESMQRAFTERSITSTTFQLPADDLAFRQELKNNTSQLAIAVGSEALRALAAGKTQIPLLTTMSFRADLKSSGILETPGIRIAGAMWLDLVIPQIVAGLRVVFPGASRIAVIRNPTQPDLIEVSVQARQPPSANVQVVDCNGPADLLPALRKLRGQADFVICLPDSTLYNKTTVEPLILASA